VGTADSLTELAAGCVAVIVAVWQAYECDAGFADESAA
jgi:hypothetical protein